MEKKNIIILIIILILIVIGTYIIVNPTKTNTPTIQSGIQANDINLTSTSTKYEIYITLSPELRNNNISMINIEFYDNTSILYRDSISIENTEEDTVQYSLEKSFIKYDIENILITYINTNGEVIGTSIKYL